MSSKTPRTNAAIAEWLCDGKGSPFLNPDSWERAASKLEKLARQLETELAASQQRLCECELDSKRLDWLEKNPLWPYSDAVSNQPWGSGIIHGASPFPTWRSAIDQAMKGDQ